MNLLKISILIIYMITTKSYGQMVGLIEEEKTSNKRAHEYLSSMKSVTVNFQPNILYKVRTKIPLTDEHIKLLTLLFQQKQIVRDKKGKHELTIKLSDTSIPFGDYQEFCVQNMPEEDLKKLRPELFPNPMSTKFESFGNSQDRIEDPADTGDQSEQPKKITRGDATFYKYTTALLGLTTAGFATLSAYLWWKN